MLKAHYSKKGIVLMCTVAYFASYFSRKTFAVVMVDMLQNNVLDRSVAGIVGTALFVFYGLGQLISGYLGDKFPPKYLMFSGLMTSALCNLLIPLSPNQYLMIPIWAVNGFAQALLWPPIVRILASNLSHEKYVTANLIVTCGAHISTIVLYVYAPICIKFMSWESVFFTSSVFCVVVGILFLVSMCLILKDCECEKPTSKSSLVVDKIPLFKTFNSSGVLLIFVCIIAMGFMRDGIESWLPMLYCEAFNRDSSESILVSVALPIFSIISLFVVRIIHKGKLFNNEARGAGILFLISALLCVPLAILISFENVVCRVVCLLLAGLTCACMHSCNFLLISCVPGRFAKTGRTSTIGGFCNACTYVGAAGSMYGIALVSELFGWRPTIISWIGFCVLGIVFAILAFHKYTKFLNHE